MGTALSSSSFGLIISPLLGGIVYAKAGYMAVFAMAISLIVVDILMRLCMIEKKTAAQYKSLESVTPDNGFYGTFTDPQRPEHEQDTDSTQPSKPYRDHEHAPLLENGAPQKKSRMPTIIVLLGTPRLLAAIYGIFVNVSILAAFDGVLPLYVQSLFHWDSLAAGLVFLCIAIPALTGPLVGKLSDKVGPKWIAVAGCALTAPPLILLRLVAHDSTKDKILLCGLLVCCGWCSSSFIEPLYNFNLSRNLIPSPFDRVWLPFSSAPHPKHPQIGPGRVTDHSLDFQASPSSSSCPPWPLTYPPLSKKKNDPIRAPSAPAELTPKHSPSSIAPWPLPRFSDRWLQVP